jgi:hypothetical protein
VITAIYAAISTSGHCFLKNGRNGGAAYAVQTAGNGGSGLLIFVL